MRRADAPPAGWYPDPENRTRLRWWDGLDWTDIRRAVPSEAEMIAFERLEALHQPAPPDPTTGARYQMPGSGMSRAETQDLITEVRKVARAELDRAAEQFSIRTQSAIESVTPLVSDYTNRILRWVRTAAIIATVLVIAWFLFQVIVSQSFFDWLGDRIDNLTDNDGSGSGSPLGPVGIVVRGLGA